MSDTRIVFVTGLSGAGISRAMKVFEDLGFYCIEHLPPAALDESLRVLDTANTTDVAVALDTLGNEALGNAVEAIDRVRDQRDVTLLYLEAREDELVRRFSETRRRHPFASLGSLRDAMTAERTYLLPLRERAAVTIDTTGLTHGALKARIAAIFAREAKPALVVTLVPFGYKYGVPLDLDLLFDVRFLRNPNYDDALRPLTGDDAPVAAFIEADPACEGFLHKLFDMLDFLLPRYIAEGKAQLTIGIGCTGGRHRSIYVARRVFDRLADDTHISLAFDPRDVQR